MTDTDGPGFTPEQAEQATRAQRAQAPGPVIPPETMARAARSAGGPAEVDVAALLARVSALEDAARQNQWGGMLHPLEATARAIGDMLAQHFAINPGADGAAVLRLAEDVTDAARNAVNSGDVSVVRDLAGRLARKIRAVHPGPGDHHWINQALDFAENHLHEAADTVTGPPSGAPAVGSGRPQAKVLEGSVTG